MRKSHNFIVPLVVYPFDIMFSVGETDKQLMDAINDRMDNEDSKVFLEDELLFNVPPTRLGYTLHNLKGGQTVVRFRNQPKTDVVAHEIFHAIEFIFDRIGLPHSRDTSESWAYALQYVTKEFYYNLNHKQK